MATVSSIGISGLPLDELLSSLRKNENQALSIIQNRQVVAETKLSAYSRLKSSVSALQKAADTVGKADSFGTMSAASSLDAVTATASNKAAAGQYSVQVHELATSQSLVAAGRNDRSTDIGTGGSISFTLGNGDIKTLDLSGQDTSLEGLVKAINADTGLGITATLINDGSASPHRLVLTTKDTGTDAAVTKIEVSNNSELEAFLAYDPDNSTGDLTVKNATNASFSINGISISSQGNTIDDAIDGVTLTLNNTTENASAAISVARDNSAAKEAIEGFVKAYNDLQGTIRSLTSYDVENQKSSALTGDSLTRSVQTRMRDAISGSLGANGTSLSMAGISTDPKTGELKIDNAKLEKALSDNLEGVKSLFSDTATGIGKRTSIAAETFTRAGGLFSSTTDSLNRTIKDIQKQFQATADRIDQRMETYRNQFTQLDSMVTQMNSLSSYLAQQLSALESINSSSRK